MKVGELVWKEEFFLASEGIREGMWSKKFLEFSYAYVKVSKNENIKIKHNFIIFSIFLSKRWRQEHEALNLQNTQ